MQSLVLLFVSILVVSASFDLTAADSSGGGYGGGGGGGRGLAAAGMVVKRNEREAIVWSEYGEISRIRLDDGNQSYQIQFFTLEANALLLPVLLQEDMVFYVHSGSGVLSYLDIDDNEMENRELRRGDIHRLRAGSVFYLQSDSEDPERQKLRFHAIFGNSGSDFGEATFEPYSSIRDVVLGFDKQVLQQIFEVPEEVIEEITREPKPGAIIQAVPRKEKTLWEKEQQYLADIISANVFRFNNKHKKSRLYNIFDDKPDFQNCNGWSTTVNRKKYSPLKHSQFGVFMVNLTTGSMMGPHWNPTATEIAVVLQGKGMVRVVCSSGIMDKECKNSIINVEEGDAFVVPRYHPMAHMAFNNDCFVFAGFSTAIKKNHPQFLAGQASVLRTLDKSVVARSFGVGDETIDRLLVNQGESVILKCVSCAEEEWKSMMEEMEREREEERKREEEKAREEEEERRRKEEEAAKKREEEKREEEERKKREEEEREREEAARREEEEARREEEERKKREEQEREEEERKKREEEEREKREREEAARRAEEEREAEERRKQEEEEAKKREEEAQQRREQEEREAREREEAERRAREEQEAEEKRKKQEEEDAKKREEEAARQREQEEIEAREREEAERRQREEQEAEEKRRKQEEEEAAQQHEHEEKEAREREEAGRRQREEQEAEEKRSKQEEEEAARQHEREEKEAREREEAEQRQREEQEAKEKRRKQEEEEEAARQHEQEEKEAREREEQETEERQRRQEEEEAAGQHEEQEAREREEEEAQQREAEARSEEEAARREEEEASRRQEEQKPRDEEAQMQERSSEVEPKTAVNVNHKGSSGKVMRKSG